LASEHESAMQFLNKHFWEVAKLQSADLIYGDTRAAVAARAEPFDLLDEELGIRQICRR